MKINEGSLQLALQQMLPAPVTDIAYTASELQGGTLGDVQLLQGSVSAAGVGTPFKLVYKRQQAWTRAGDPHSWRREYDLYTSKLADYFDDQLRWAKAYHVEATPEEITLWLEYLEGASGKELTVSTLTAAAYQLGSLQGRIAKNPEQLHSCTNLGDPGFLEREYSQWLHQHYDYDYLVSPQCRLPQHIKMLLQEGSITLIPGKSFEYSLLRSPACDLPGHLQDMLLAADAQASELFQRFKNLPVLFCHRDFWVENIIQTPGFIGLIDWDTTGWGYLGEDLASLLVDDIAADLIPELAAKAIPAYIEGLSSYIELPSPQLVTECIWEMALVKFGYRLMASSMYKQNPTEREEVVKILECIHQGRINYGY